MSEGMDVVMYTADLHVLKHRHVPQNTLYETFRCDVI